MNNKDLLYKKLNALRLEVHGSIVDNIKLTVDAIFQEQLLLQTQCATPLEALQQMLNKVEKEKPSIFSFFAYEKWESQLRNIRGVLQLIKQSQPC